MKKNNFFINILPLLLILLLCIPVILPFLKLGYFPTHDGEWAVVRLADMFRSLRDLQFPVRFSGALNFGYGYPLFNFAYPFPYYLGVLVYIPLNSFVLSIKVLFVLSVFFSAIFMYLASGMLWKNKLSAIVSSILYIYLPYRMVDLYVRGSLGESLSFVLFPLILYLSLRLFKAPFGRITVVSLSVSFSVLIMTHNIMTILFLFLILIFILARIIYEKRYDVLQSFILSFILGIGLSTFFWLPAIFEKGNILLSKIPIADRSLHFANPLQLLIPSWGYAPSTESDGFSYQLGIAQIIVVLLSLIYVLYSRFKGVLLATSFSFYVYVLMILYFIYLMLIFSFTSFIWETIPLLREINFPWTVLSQLGFISSLLAGFIVLQGKYLKFIVLGLVIISIATVYSYAKPNEYVNRGEGYYLTNEATTTSSTELMPLWVKEAPTMRYVNKVEVIAGRAEISNLRFNSRKMNFEYRAENDVTFRINTLYYPGWKAYVDGDRVDISFDNKFGVMDIRVSQFDSRVRLIFDETPLRLFSDFVSILGFIAVFFIIIRPVLKFK